MIPSLLLWVALQIDMGIKKVFFRIGFLLRRSMGRGLRGF